MRERVPDGYAIVDKDGRIIPETFAAGLDAVARNECWRRIGIREQWDTTTLQAMGFKLAEVRIISNLAED